MLVGPILPLMSIPMDEISAPERLKFPVGDQKNFLDNIWYNQNCIIFVGGGGIEWVQHWCILGDKEKIVMHPYIVAVGESKKNITQYFIIIDNFALTCLAHGAVGAIDTVIKIHYRFEFQLPLETPNNHPVSMKYDRSCNWINEVFQMPSTFSRHTYFDTLDYSIFKCAEGVCCRTFYSYSGSCSLLNESQPVCSTWR